MLFAVAASAPQDVETGGEDTRVGGAVGGAGWEVKAVRRGKLVSLDFLRLFNVLLRALGALLGAGSCYFPLNRALCDSCVRRWCGGLGS